MGRPREHDEATGVALLDAAESLLSAGGLEAVSVRRVAQAVGTSTRAVYSLFGSREGLVAALAVRGYRTLTARVEGLVATDDAAADLVAVGLDGFREFALTRPQLFRVTFERAPAEVVGDPAAREASQASYRALVRWIRRAQAAGVVDDRPVSEVAFAFHCLCAGLASGELARAPAPIGTGFWGPVRGVDGVRLWRSALEALVAGLRPVTSSGVPAPTVPRFPVERSDA